MNLFTMFVISVETIAITSSGVVARACPVVTQVLSGEASLNLLKE